MSQNSNQIEKIPNEEINSPSFKEQNPTFKNNQPRNDIFD